MGRGGLGRNRLWVWFQSSNHQFLLHGFETDIGLVLATQRVDLSSEPGFVCGFSGGCEREATARWIGHELGGLKEMEESHLKK